MGRIIAPFGGQFVGAPPEAGLFWHFEYIDADTPDEVRKAVRRNIFYGAQAIKLVCDNNPYHCSEAEVRAAVEEAHSAGLPVSVRAFLDEAARAVVMGGADSIEHAQAMSAAIVDRLKRAHRLGVTLAFGTDVTMDLPGRTRADMMFDYLDVWASAGITPAETLRAMTTTAADLLRVKSVRGAIAVGQAADVIATPENPLARVQALRKICFVMKNGDVVRNTG